MLTVHSRSAPAEKVALFRALFRGREDVYARRFESRRTGRAGYAPACALEWKPGICEKPRVRCAECRHRQFLPLTDEVIRWHLTGIDERGAPFVAGIYPLLEDDSCHFLAFDFDKQTWQADVLAVWETCRRGDVPAAVELSRSGQGAHLWLFFNEAIPASLARQLGTSLLTSTMERRPEVGLDSYDRLFPNQDTLPRGGFGNLIALPLQAEPRKQGRSVFVDERLQPVADPWFLLSAQRRIARSQAENWVERARRHGRVLGVRMPPVEDDWPVPWEAPPSRRSAEPTILGGLPRQIELTLADEIYVQQSLLPSALRDRLLRIAAFQNPEFYRAQALRLSTYDKPRVIGCAADYGDYLGLPRGCLEEVQSLLTDLGVAVALRDARQHGVPLRAAFRGQLHPAQLVAARDLAAHDNGVLCATTAFGKTVVAAWLIALRGVNTLVLVHRRQLLDQWLDRLATFLDLSLQEFGQIGGGRRRPTGKIDVALIQSLKQGDIVDDIVADYGHLIIDECHHVSARSFELIARRAKARFVLGLSATVARKDGRHPIVTMQCGPIRYTVDAKSAAQQRPFAHAVHVRPTSFSPPDGLEEDLRRQYQQLCHELVSNDARNQLICADAVQCTREGRSPLVLTQRKDHLQLLASALEDTGPKVVTLHGGRGVRAIRETAAQLAAILPTEPRILLATGAYLGEGFDDPRLDTLLLALPVSWRGTIAQYVGRLHRLREGKTEVRVIDYADLEIPMLARMFHRRCRAYEGAGYQVLLPGSAIAGWPAEVPLPVDPPWRQQFAATVARLVRDGVDQPLARLFVNVIEPVPPDALGVARARSAAEAFFYQRIESLPSTAGRFQLNATLAIPWDGCGMMEVDLLCQDARLAIEIDGAQHLESFEAYRRDRRKDLLLQQHGYLVMRFLAADVGPRLDEILDQLLRTLASRNSCR